MSDCGEDLIDETFALGGRSRLRRGTRRVWRIDGERGPDLDRWHGHEFGDCSGFDVDDLGRYDDDFDSSRPDYLPISFDCDSNTDDYTLDNRDPDRDGNSNSDGDCDRDGNPVHRR